MQEEHAHSTQLVRPWLKGSCQTQNKANRATSADQWGEPSPAQITINSRSKGPRFSAISFAGYRKEDSASPSLKLISYHRKQAKVVHTCGGKSQLSACTETALNIATPSIYTGGVFPLGFAYDSYKLSRQKSFSISHLWALPYLSKIIKKIIIKKKNRGQLTNWGHQREKVEHKKVVLKKTFTGIFSAYTLNSGQFPQTQFSFTVCL